MLESLVISGPVTSMVDLRNDVGMMSTGNAINMQRSYYCKKNSRNYLVQWSSKNKDSIIISVLPVR